MNYETKDSSTANEGDERLEPPRPPERSSKAEADRRTPPPARPREEVTRDLQEREELVAKRFRDNPNYQVPY